MERDNKMQRCVKCGLPETQETISYDREGICSICRQHEVKHDVINWAERKRELGVVVEKYRGKPDYDCIIPFSGGKDSTWTLYYLVKEYGIKPLVVRFDHGFLRPNLEENVKKVMRKLGVDFLTFTPNWKVVRKLMLQSLLEKGDFCWHCHTGIFSYPMWIAIEKRIPLIFWGEPSSEYASYFNGIEVEEVDENRFNRMTNLGISADDMMLRMGGEFDSRDFKPYSYPPVNRLREIGTRSVCLGSYIKWNPRNQSAIIEKELGWTGDQVENVPPEYRYEKIECYMQGVRDYLKFIKRGFSRPSHLVAVDIRNGEKSSGEGKDLISEWEGRRPPSLNLFLNFVGLSEEEFNQIAATHAVSPYDHDFSKTRIGLPLLDMDKWCADGGLPRDEALQQWKSFQDSQ